MPDIILSQHAAIPQSANPNYTQGQLANVLMDPTTGGLKVFIAGGGGSGGTSSVDEAAFTVGVTAGTPMMGVVNPSDTPPNGDLAVVALDSSRNLKISGSFSSTPATSSTVTAALQVALGTTTATALAANALRKGFIIQNQGTTAIKIVLGTGTLDQNNYMLALPACGNNNDGSSPVWYGPQGVLWLGVVKWVSSAAGGLAEVVELT